MATPLAKTLAATGCQEILIALDEGGARPFGDLARRVQDKSTANRALRRLIDAGLIERHVLQDRLRSVDYNLTSRGREVAQVARSLREIERSMHGRERGSGRGGFR